jgi:hypothetical protein
MTGFVCLFPAFICRLSTRRENVMEKQIYPLEINCCLLIFTDYFSPEQGKAVHFNVSVIYFSLSENVWKKNKLYVYPALHLPGTGF